MSSSYTSGSGSGSKSTGSGTVTTTIPAATNIEFWSEYPDSFIQLSEPSPWQTGKLAGKPCPGIMDVEVSGASRKVDAQSPPAKGGAKIVVKGWTPSEVTVKVTIWTPSQWEAWQALKPFLRVDQSGTNTVSIDHAVAAESDITQLTIKKISGVHNGTIVGTKQITIEAIDAGQPKTTGTGTAKGGKSDALVWFELYKAYVIGIRANSGGGGYWLTWSTWIMQNGHPELCGPNPPGYAAYAPPGMP